MVVNCRAMEKHVIADEGFDPGAVYLCYNGIDTDVFRPGMRSRPAVVQDAELVIGVVCALRPEKDLLTLLESFSRIDGANLRLRLLFVGSGPMLSTLRQRSVELHVAERCVFQPATPQVAEWLRAMDIFVLPSVSEAFSNALMEAMACECAVVASRVGGNPELVFDGETGLLFNAGDADGLAVQLRRLIADAGLRSSLAANASRFIRESFSLSTYTRRMEEVYAEVLGMRTRQAPAELHPAARV
jgi:glycosyltransferase involved in cell wall biosynthesis